MEKEFPSEIGFEGNMETEGEYCAVHEAIQVLQEKWTMHIVRAVLAACGGAPARSATAHPTPSASATADACAAPAPGPPTGDVSAAFATALAFAPDGRLFYAERGGTVRVWQQGAAHVFAHVNTVT